MLGSIGIRHWLRKALPSVLISLCILSLFFVLVPDLHNFDESISAPISIYPSIRNYAPAFASFTVGNSLYTTKRGEGYTHRRAVLMGDAVLPPPYGHFIPNGLTRNYLNSSHTIFKGGFQQACQLLDIPPPSNLVS